jgi:ribonuclease HI
MKDAKVYCDGSCLNNPGSGGWCSILVCLKNNKRYIKIISGGCKLTTNNEMELQALVKTLSLLKNSDFVKVFTDSKYLINKMSFWKKKEKLKKINNSRRLRIINKYFQDEFKIFKKMEKISWNWVKSHIDNKFNIKADIEAKRQAILYSK